MSWFARPFGTAPPAPDAPHALLADIEKRGKQYLDEVDNGKWVYPACKRTSSDGGAGKDQIRDHTRLEAMRYLLTVPRGEFRLLAEPDSQPAILEAYLRQSPHDETVIEFTGNTMSDLAISVIADSTGSITVPALPGLTARSFQDAQSLPKGCDVGAEMVGDEGRQGALRGTVAGAAGAAAVSVSGLGGLWPPRGRNRRGAEVMTGKDYPFCA